LTNSQVGTIRAIRKLPFPLAIVEPTMFFLLCNWASRFLGAIRIRHEEKKSEETEKKRTEGFKH